MSARVRWFRAECNGNILRLDKAGNVREWGVRTYPGDEWNFRTTAELLFSAPDGINEISYTAATCWKPEIRNAPFGHGAPY